MAMLTVRNLPEEVHRALRARAVRSGQSMEAEVRSILEAAVQPQREVKLGSLLSAIGRGARLTDAEVDLIAQQREQSTMRPVDFG